MKRLATIVALFALLLLTPIASAQQFDLPTDDQKWYFTVAGDMPYAIRGKAVDEMKAKCYYRHIPEHDPIYSRYAPYIGDTPAVFVQRHDGKVIFKASGANFPKTIKDLESKLLDCRPKPQPSPSPAPVPLPVPLPPPSVPDVEPEPTPESEGDDELSTLMLIIFALAGGGGALYSEFSKGEK